MSGVTAYCGDCKRSSGWAWSLTDLRRVGWFIREAKYRTIIRCPACRDDA